MAIDITTLSPAVLKAKNVATESYDDTQAKTGIVMMQCCHHLKL